MNPSDIRGEGLLLTGGSGTLGSELRSLLPGIVAPTRDELDVLDSDSIARALGAYRPVALVHAAAFTDVSGAEERRGACWNTNVQGTANVVRAAAAAGVGLVHISTDYVFEGSRGGYVEDDPVGPALNYYALTKIAAEAVVRACPDHLVIRTSFRPREWAYPVAFDDLYTSQDYVDVVAPALVKAIVGRHSLGVSTVHVATERKSLYELASRRSSVVRRGSKREADVRLPDDISLDTSLWDRLEADLD